MTCAPEERPGGRVVVAGGDAEFLQGIQGGAHRAGEGISVELIVVVETIEGDVGLVAAGSVHRASAAVVVLVHVLADVDNAGLQAQNRNRIAALRGQIGELPRIEVVAQRRVLGVDDRRFARDIYDNRRPPCTCNDMLIVAGLLTCNTTFSRLVVAKPEAVTVMT